MLYVFARKGPEEKLAKGKEPSFEEALKALESIVAKLESGETKLEESIRLFEEGMRLSAICQKRLDEADRKIEVLLRKPGGVTQETEDEEDVLGKEE
jgi:exodeoxyribonuclease VII small subunit